MSRVIRQAVLLMVVAAVPAALAGLWHPRRPAFTMGASAPLQQGEVQLATALQWGQSVLWIDARSPGDYQTSHIPGALPLNEDSWDEQLPAMIEAWTPSRRVVVYCSTRQCRASDAVARRLRREMQWNDVYVLHGGWEAWKEARP